MQAEQSIYGRIQSTAMMSTAKTEILVSKLIHLNEQSEIGFDAAAHHIRNRALKIWLKTCAQQRREFAEELRSFTQSHAMQERSTDFQTLTARLHRGWIDARSIMVIGRNDRERFILEQALYAEDRAVARSYHSALNSNIPAELTQLLQEQHTKINVVREYLESMLGDNGEQLIVQLFDSESDTRNAIAELNELHSGSHKTSVKPLADVMKHYEAEQSGRRMELVSASMILGVASGAVLGFAIAAVSAVATPIVPTLTLILLGSAFGVLCGLIFGLIGGYSNVEEDRHIYESAQQTGKVFMFTQIPVDRVSTIRKILRRHRWNAGEAVTSTP